jgi:UDP-N-acetylglucosamine 1-carboxyvinyltransferase
MSIFEEKKKSLHEWQAEFKGYQKQYNEPSYMVIDQSPALSGEASLVGAKNAVLVIMTSLILVEGKSILRNVPNNADVQEMIVLLQELGADVFFDVDHHTLHVDTTLIHSYKVRPHIMKKMRASVLVMGPLLARFGKADIALPGGDVIGSRPIDFHVKGLAKMGVVADIEGEFLRASVATLKANRIVLEYPSVGATENIMMAAVRTPGLTTIINAAIEPEVLDLIEVLKKMGSQINVVPPSIIEIQGVDHLKAVDHEVMYDRLEAGALLLAAAMTGGRITLPQARAHDMDVFLFKLEEMGHAIERGQGGKGVTLIATTEPRAVSFRTTPYPGFPTDLQPTMMAALCCASGKSVIYETVHDSRFLHVRELQKMGAHISIEGDRAVIIGVEQLYGAPVIASDIRASCALVLAALKAQGTTTMLGVHHWRRGYEALEKKLAALGAPISLKTAQE